MAALIQNFAPLILVTFGAVVFFSAGCSTTYTEFQGECVVQEWKFASTVLRRRQLCDLPPPNIGYVDKGETSVSEREAMDINPFPDLIGEKNDADTSDPNLLEKRMLLNKMERTSDKEALRIYIKQYQELQKSSDEHAKKQKKDKEKVIE